ncbi:L-serine ammonia-lyase [Helicobacter didelphidarum]|uniref:L-serine dehydratase n=1 Tax=Helicobacter didelphidarum TaxID=2040648 RepID=A0A3D8IQZ4_9HELI|nr:L-serine ammonia-lyase [Helicobacter didelphidarum]RDU67679.1 L-serine ammonia-lyase [Helicobacter didelphidarum]
MSNLNIFKIGVGPSSSHTLGPLVAGNLFCNKIESNNTESKLDVITKITINLHGSLSLTGKGHLTDKAILWGLSNLKPRDLHAEIQEQVNKGVLEHKILNLCGKKQIMFDYDQDLVFNNDYLPLHENGLEVKAFDNMDNIIESQVYYSVGGGFVKTKEELEDGADSSTQANVKMQIDNATKALYLCDEKGYNLAQLSLEYEKQFVSESNVREYCLEIWATMQEVYMNGINPKADTLPGGMHLHRRAKGLAERVKATTDPMGIIDFISLYAISIAEENASGAKVVTAPTNGACAVIPAVMLYLKNHTIGFNDDKAVEFLLTAMLIGSFYKKNASISGAEAGCQAEIGSASSMAAGAMATVLGAEARKACNAAEMAMEHHLGLTCDPVGGLVQIPCIERNAFGAIKAISAARMAMTRKSIPMVSLDEVIKTMYQTGKDMNAKYRETSLGGLAKTLSSVC